MTQINGWMLTGNVDTFRQGATAFRNARDWAKEQRDQFVVAANARAAQLDTEQLNVAPFGHNAPTGTTEVQDEEESENWYDGIDRGDNFDVASQHVHWDFSGSQDQYPVASVFQGDADRQDQHGELGYQYLNPQRQGIRLLSLLPGAGGDPIRREVFHASLTAFRDPTCEAPNYEALSYVWGSSGDTVPILLNGREFNVKKIYMMRSNTSGLQTSGYCGPTRFASTKANKLQ